MEIGYFLHYSKWKTCFYLIFLPPLPYLRPYISPFLIAHPTAPVLLTSFDRLLEGLGDVVLSQDGDGLVLAVVLDQGGVEVARVVGGPPAQDLLIGLKTTDEQRNG